MNCLRDCQHATSLAFDMSTRPPQFEGGMAKIARKSKEQPLVPLGRYLFVSFLSDNRRPNHMRCFNRSTNWYKESRSKSNSAHVQIASRSARIHSSRVRGWIYIL